MNKIDYTLVNEAINHPDFFTSLMILFVFIFIITIIILPIIYSSNKRFDRILNNTGKFNTLINDSLIQIKNAIENHNTNSEEQFEIIKDNIGKVTLNKEQTIDLLKTHMWYVTWKKLEFIKGIILNNHIAWNEDKVREKVKNWLIALSDEYLSKFQSYQTPIWNLAKWLNENFTKEDFCKLVDDIMILIYKEYEWWANDILLNKTNEIAMIMRTLQVWLANQLRNDIYKI